MVETSCDSKHLCALFDIDKTVKWIKDNGFKKVALQLPDSLLSHSYDICKQLEHLSNIKIYIAVDTTYSNCCIDEISAKHVEAEAIVHYGHACLSPCLSRVYYVHPKSTLNIEATIKAIASIANENCHFAVFYQTTFEHICTDISEAIYNAFPKTLIAKLDNGNRHTSVDNIFGRILVNSDGHTVAADEIKNRKLIYIGDEDQTLFNLAITVKMQELYILNTTKYDINPYSQSVWMKRRRYIVEKCKDAQNICILVCTLSIANFNNIIQRLKELIKLNGKRSYVLTVGKPNIAKLSNVYEMDVFVLIACPENDLYGCRDFNKPIAYPFELELALNKKRDPYSTDYFTDFNDLLADGKGYCEMEENTEANSDISLITGSVRINTADLTTIDDDRINKNRSIDTIRSEEWAMTELGIGDALAGRSWKGLEQKLGENKVEKAQEGRRGIASGYEKEPI